MSHIRLTEPKVRDYVARGVDPNVLDSRGKPRPRIYRDDKVRGLFIEVNPLSASYKVQSTLRKAGPRPITIRRTLGRTTDFTLEQARRWAEEVLGTVRRGELPTDTADAEPTLRSLYDRYAEMRERQGKDVTHTSNIQLNSRTHLGDWLDLRVSKITQAMVEERHSKIGHGYTKDGERVGGPYAANHTIKQLRAVLNSYPATRKANPVEGIVWFKSSEELDEHGQPISAALPLDALPGWWKATESLGNPVRKCLHRLALLSGMRYGHLVETRRAWVNLDQKCIRYPKLKRGRAFTLPLSVPMLEAVREVMAIELKDNPYLFWAESKSGHIEDWREKVTNWREWADGEQKQSLPTGHCLRHTYVSIAHATRLTDHHRRVLVDHSAGKDVHATVYTDLSHSFRELLAAQEEVSARIVHHIGGAADPALSVAA